MKVLNELIYVEPASEKGYNFGFFIRISNAEKGKKFQLIGEGNNCGVCDTAEEAYQKSLWEIEYNGLVCKRLQSLIEHSAIIYPCFPRPRTDNGTGDIYTHDISSAAIHTKESSIRRVDKQFLAMIEEAKRCLSNLGYNTSEKVIMTGFSASSKFAERFAFLHPEIVSSVIAGGMGALPCLPIDEFQGEKLNFPLGTNDYQELTGKQFDLAKFNKIKKYYFMGGKDQNDPAKWKDCYTDDERRIIYKIYDSDMQKRWDKMIEVFEELKLSNVNTYLFKDVAHSPQGMEEVLKKNLNEILEKDNQKEKKL